MMLHRCLVPLAVAAAAGLASADASAATICVGTDRPECTAPIETNLQTALTRADGSAGADTVLVGPGTFTTASVGGFASFGNDPIEVRGAGPGRTILRSTATAPTSVLSVHPGAPAPSAAVVGGLTVLGRSLANSGAALRASGTVEDAAVSIDGNGNFATYAIRLSDGTHARRLTAVAAGPAAVGIGMSGGTLEDAQISAPFAVEAVGAPSVIRRLRSLVTSVGIQACNARVTVESSSFEVANTNATGIELEGAQRCGVDPSQLVARQVTIVGAGGIRQGTGVGASAGSVNVVADVRESVLRNLTSSIVAMPGAGYTSTLTLERLAEEPARRTFGGTGNLVLSDLGGHVTTDPKLVDLVGGDLRPGTGSPLIDAGTAGPLEPGESPFDLGGMARLSDGDGDGTSRRDIGAYEAAAVAPPLPAVPTPPPAPPAPLAPVIAVPPGGTKPLPVIVPTPKDTKRPTLSRARLRLGRSRRLTVTSTEPATLRLEVRALPERCRKPSRSCRERTVLRARFTLVRRGSVSLKLSKALAKRLGARGVRARLRATDAAGNLSKPVYVRAPR